MKKLISLLLLLLIFTSCTKKPDFDSGFSIETYKCDMSGYKGVNSVNHNFKGTTVSELKKCIDEKGYGAFILSRTNCDHCQIAMQYINKAAEDLGVFVYYIDGISTTYPIVDTPDYKVLDELLKSIEEANDEGVIELQTPHFFTIVDGEFVKSYIGANIEGDEITEDEANALYKKYYNALKIFVE